MGGVGGGGTRRPAVERIAVPWIILIAAGIFEIGWAVGLKYTEGFTRLWPSLLTVAAMAVSFALLAAALRSLPLGTAYAVWTGIGTIGTAAYGVLVLSEPADGARMACIAMIAAGIIGLKLVTQG